MKNQALFSLKDKSKQLKCRLLQVLFGASRVYVCSIVCTVNFIHPGDVVSDVVSADFVDTYSLLRWCQKILNSGKYHTINVTDLTSSWKSGLAFCALIHYFKPEAM